MNFNVVYLRKSEHQRLAFTLKNITFYKEKGYRVLLPKGATLDQTSENDIFELADQEFPDKLVIDVKNKVILEIQRYKDSIDLYIKSIPYKAPEEVRIILTQYGVGGSYNVYSSEIVINIKYKFDFMSLIMHELTHILVDKELVYKFNLDHDEKENLIKWLLSNSLILKDFVSVPRKTKIKPPGEDVLEELKRLNYSPV